MKKMKAPEGLGLENYKFTELSLNKIFKYTITQRRGFALVLAHSTRFFEALELFFMRLPCT